MKFESNVQTKPRRMVIIRNRGIISTAVLIALVFIVYVCTLSLKTSSRQLEYASYPRTYAEYVEKEAKECHLEPALVYAVIKQESGFDPKCVSNAGAIGLMQIMPDTFHSLTAEMNKSDGREYMEDDLYDPKTNIRFGCKYLSILLKVYPKPATALAAYNAGMGNVGGWLQDKNFSDDRQTLRKIPFPETQQYTQKVLENYVQYKRLYYTQAVSAQNK